MRQRRIISTPIHERYPKRQTALNKLEKSVLYFNTGLILLRNERHKLKLKSKSTNERCKINAAKKNLAFETHLSRPCSFHFRQTIQSYTVRRISLLGSLRVDEDGSRIGNAAAGLISKSWWYLSSYLSQFFARPARPEDACSGKLCLTTTAGNVESRKLGGGVKQDGADFLPKCSTKIRSTS